MVTQFWKKEEQADLREGEVQKKERKGAPSLFPSLLPMLACSRYVRPKGRQSFQRNMIAALLQKALSFKNMTSVSGESWSVPFPGTAFLPSTKPHQRDLVPLKRPFKTFVFSRSCSERMWVYRRKKSQVKIFSFYFEILLTVSPFFPEVYQSFIIYPWNDLFLMYRRVEYMFG